MAIPPTPSVASYAAVVQPSTNNKPRAAPASRQALRHDSNNSLSTVSTASSSSSSEASSPRKTNNKSKKRGRRTKKNTPPKNNTVVEAVSAQERARYVALDCEMVGVGPTGRWSALARVSLVDWDGNAVLDEYVQPDQAVTDYRTHVSGVTPQHLEQATHTLATIRPVVAALLRDKILVGHGLKADLTALQLAHPWYDIRDTAKYEPFMQVRFNDGILWPRKLRDLVAARPQTLGDLIDGFQQRSHCSVADAVAALRLYQTVRTKWEKVMEYKKSKTLQIMQQQQELSSSSSSSDDSSLSSSSC